MRVAGVDGMTEADQTQLWYCWSCDREWDFNRTETKICPACNVHGVRSDDIG